MDMFSLCTNLKQAPELPATQLTENCYYAMFSDCRQLTDAPELPADSLAVDCYHSMFNNCISLTKAPELPALVMKQYCYNKMFFNCTSLKDPCELPATSLDEDCYKDMFSGCTSLTKAPELPATELKTRCYKGMFSGCTSLTQAPELPATELAPYCYADIYSGCSNLSEITVGIFSWDDNSTMDWVANVAPTGSFICPEQLEKEYNDNHIPVGWNMEQDETPDSSSVEPENLIFWKEGLTLFVNGEQDNVEIYNINGQLIHSAQGNSPKSHTFTMPAHGVFIVRIGNRNHTVEF